jgi:hypothetical protein
MEIIPTAIVSPAALSIGTPNSTTRLVSEIESEQFRALTSVEPTTSAPTTSAPASTTDVLKFISSNIVNNMVTQAAEERQRLADAIEGKDS